MRTILILNMLTAMASLIAGILWLLSSTVRFNIDNGVKLGETGKVLLKQSKISAWAAIFATIGALSQSIVFFVK